MEVLFSRGKPIISTKADGSKESRPGLPVIHQLTFCCEEMADEVIQKPCSFSPENPNEIWFCSGTEMEYCARYCQFCGEKIDAKERPKQNENNGEVIYSTERDFEQ